MIVKRLPLPDFFYVCGRISSAVGPTHPTKATKILSRMGKPTQYQSRQKDVWAIACTGCIFNVMPRIKLLSRVQWQMNVPLLSIII